MTSAQLTAVLRTPRHHATWLSSFRFLILAAIFSAVTILLFLRRSSFSFAPVHETSLPPNPLTELGSQRLDQHGFDHPIGQLILQAQEQQACLLAKQSNDLSTAAYRYRERRGRHPPPGFDAWVRYALEHDAIVIEEFFDRIYDDLNPYWALEPPDIRRRAAPWNHDHCISIRDHNATLKTTEHDAMGRMLLWHGLIQELEQHLPDVDLPMNIMDESRVLVRWEEVNDMVQLESKRRHMPPLSEIQASYSSLPSVDAPPIRDEALFDAQWITEDGNHYWDLFRQSCAPNSPARNVPSIDIYIDPPAMPSSYPLHSYHGYVSNWTLSRDPCEHPELRTLHGTFIEPISLRTSQHLLPIFGGSKLPTNNEILIPPAMYLATSPTGSVDYSGGGYVGPSWPEKKDGIIWRGVASGGRNKVDTWPHFHRHRLLQMLNGSSVSAAETVGPSVFASTAQSFTIPDPSIYPLLSSSSPSGLGGWIESLSDAAFTHLWCFPREQPDHLCSYTDPFFEVREGVPMPQQYAYKYLPDVDGNSFSGRFRAFLRSTSVPVKTTIYSEWHDARLQPWVHFIPIDNSFVDLYAVLEFFMGFEGRGRHDTLAEKIADDGRIWAEKVLRREDMALYFWRLILEWARVGDDKRDVLGWADDLKGEN